VNTENSNGADESAIRGDAVASTRHELAASLSDLNYFSGQRVRVGNHVTYFNPINAFIFDFHDYRRKIPNTPPVTTAPQMMQPTK
jgi:hypothetical protein